MCSIRAVLARPVRRRCSSWRNPSTLFCIRTSACFLISAMEVMAGRATAWGPRSIAEHLSGGSGLARLEPRDALGFQARAARVARVVAPARMRGPDGIAQRAGGRLHDDAA